MKKLFLFFSLLATIGLASCEKEECKENMDQDCYYIQIYDPVCGCNGKTYSNSGHAECSGITEYTKGEC